MSKRKLYIVLTLILAVTILCCLFLSAPVSVAADISTDVVVSLCINDPIMEVNGIETEIDAGRGTMPIVKNDRTLVPIRAIIEAFGGEVDWEEDTQSVLLTLEEDCIKLVIDDTIAYYNNTPKTLDVAPTVINGRTMLPIRFVAEGFHLGVAWDGETETVSVLRDTFEPEEYDALKKLLPEYSGKSYTRINNNTPFFRDYEMIPGSFEYYSELDDLGRCDVCFASVSVDLMPTKERENISSVTPTGWVNASYDTVEGGYLYNRCHLIGFQLTGENANERNLITGTRYLNVDGMLPFENAIADYAEETGNHVIYRSTPVFRGDNLVADGVLLEAYSVEDKGRGISFCVYCYNVQPSIVIDYATGKNYAEGIIAETEEIKAETNDSVYRTPSGKKYHLDFECGGKNSYAVSFAAAKQAGLTPCSKCVE